MVERVYPCCMSREDILDLIELWITDSRENEIRVADTGDYAGSSGHARDASLLEQLLGAITDPNSRKERS